MLILMKLSMWPCDDSQSRTVESFLDPAWPAFVCGKSSCGNQSFAVVYHTYLSLYHLSRARASKFITAPLTCLGHTIKKSSSYKSTHPVPATAHRKGRINPDRQQRAKPASCLPTPFLLTRSSPRQHLDNAVRPSADHPAAVRTPNNCTDTFAANNVLRWNHLKV